MVSIESITEFNPPTPIVSPTLIGVSDKKDYIVKLKSDTGDTSENIIGLRLYLGCHKDGNNTITTSNCRLSVIGNSDQRYSAINPINPEAEKEAKVLRYIITNEDITELTREGSSGIEIKVQLETSQDSAIDRTPEYDKYVLKAHIQYALKERIEVTQCSTRTANAHIFFKVSKLI